MGTRTDAPAAGHDLEGINSRDELKIGCPICEGSIPPKTTAVVWLGADGQILVAHVDCVYPRVVRVVS